MYSHGVLSLIQIYAIVALLTAFNVPQPTVDTVQGILMATQAPTALIATSSPEIGGIGAPVTRVTCDPVIRSWPVDWLTIEKGSYQARIDQVWVYTPCQGTWYLDAGSNTLPMTFNGTQNSGPYTGLNSYVAKGIVLLTATTTSKAYTFTVKAHSPDSNEATSTTL